MRSFISDPFIEPFDVMYHPFRGIDYRMRHRMHMHAPYPSSLISRAFDDENLEQLVKNECPQVSEDGTSILLNFKLPDHVDPNKINVSTKDRDVIVKVEDKIEKNNSTTEYSYYQRSSLPSNVDFESMKAFVNDNRKEVSIQAALKKESEEKTSSPRQITIQSEKQQEVKN